MIGGKSSIWEVENFAGLQVKKVDTKGKPRLQATVIFLKCLKTGHRFRTQL